MACPRAAISRASAGNARTCWPIRKKVARASSLSSKSRSAGVAAGFGPSSNVSATVDASPVVHTVRPNSCDRVCTAPHAPTAAPPNTTAPAVAHGFTRAFSHASRCARATFRRAAPMKFNSDTIRRNVAARARHESKIPQLAARGRIDLACGVDSDILAVLGRAEFRSSLRHCRDSYVRGPVVEQSPAAFEPGRFVDCGRSDVGPRRGVAIFQRPYFDWRHRIHVGRALPAVGAAAVAISYRVADFASVVPGAGWL